MADPVVLDWDGCAKLLGVCRRSVQNYVKRDGLPCHRLGPSKVRFFADEVLAWLRNRDQKGAPINGTRAA